MQEIKIFVSSRIDLESYCPENQLFVPVRCGAVYDERNTDIAGDNTGENISEKRMSFNELTVQYWAWKNADADYYGLCHYRRFLNFSKKRYKENYHCQVEIPFLNAGSASEYGLTDEKEMRELIEQYDAVVVEECPVSQIPSPMGYPKTAYDLWANHSQFLLLPSALTELKKAIQYFAPDIAPYAEEYLAGDTFRGYNCYVMKREIFNRMCEFEFPILFEVEKHLNYSHATETTQRTCGYLSEILFSIYIYYLKRKNYRVKETQLLVFGETEEPVAVKLDNTVKNIALSLMDFEYTSAIVLLESINQLPEAQNLHITILEKNLTDDMREKIRLSNKRPDEVTISFYKPMAVLAALCPNSNIAENVQMWPFFIPWIFTGAERLLWIAPNTIFMQDVSPLFQMDIEGKMLGASLDVIVQKELNNPLLPTKKIIEKMRLDDSYAYFDDSVLLMNLTMLRMLDPQRLSEALCGPTFCRLPKDFWNVFVQNDKVMRLSYRWNIHPQWADSLDAINDLTPLCERKIWREAAKTPAIIVSDIWRNPDAPFALYFWRFARNTIVYERILCEVPNLHQTPSHTSLSDYRSGARKFADKLLPKGTRRREFAKKILPKGSRRWKFCKQIYYIFCPQYRPPKP